MCLASPRSVPACALTDRKEGDLPIARGNSSRLGMQAEVEATEPNLEDVFIAATRGRQERTR